MAEEGVAEAAGFFFADGLGCVAVELDPEDLSLAFVLGDDRFFGLLGEGLDGVDLDLDVI